MKEKDDGKKERGEGFILFLLTFFPRKLDREGYTEQYTHQDGDVITIQRHNPSTHKYAFIFRFRPFTPTPSPFVLRSPFILSSLTLRSPFNLLYTDVTTRAVIAICHTAFDKTKIHQYSGVRAGLKVTTNVNNVIGFFWLRTSDQIYTREREEVCKLVLLPYSFIPSPFTDSH